MACSFSKPKEEREKVEVLSLLPYFIDQSPRRLIISFCRYLRRLFEGGDYSRAASISSSTPNFLAAPLGALFSTVYSFKLECSIIRPFLRRHFLY